MSESHWRDQSSPIIARVIAEHAGESESAVRLALREAFPFGPRMYHPYKIWLDEIARQLGTKPKLGTRTAPYPGKPKLEEDPRQDLMFDGGAA